MKTVNLIAAILIMCAGFWIFFGKIVTAPRSNFEEISNFERSLEGIRDRTTESKTAIVSRELHIQMYYFIFGADDGKHLSTFAGIILFLDMITFFLLCSAFTRNYYLCSMLSLLVMINPFLLKMTWMNCWNRTILFFVFLAIFFFHKVWNDKKWYCVPGIAAFFILSFMSYYHYGAFVGVYMLLYTLAHFRSLTLFRVIAGILIISFFTGYCHLTWSLILHANQDLAQQTITMYLPGPVSYLENIVVFAILFILVTMSGRKAPFFLILLGGILFSLSMGEYLCSENYEYVMVLNHWIRLPGYWFFKIGIINRLREIQTFSLFGVAIMGVALSVSIGGGKLKNILIVLLLCAALFFQYQTPEVSKLIQGL